MILFYCYELMQFSFFFFQKNAGLKDRKSIFFFYNYSVKATTIQLGEKKM